MSAAIKLDLSGEADLEATRGHRRTPRAMAYLCVDVCTEQSFWTALTMNLSEGGVFVASHVLLPVESLVGLHFELPRERRILTLGEVRWIRTFTGDDDVPPGFGCKFVGLDPDARAAIARYVDASRGGLRVVGR